MEFCQYCRVDLHEAEPSDHGPNCPAYRPGPGCEHSEHDERLDAIEQKLDRLERLIERDKQLTPAEVAAFKELLSFAETGIGVTAEPPVSVVVPRKLFLKLASVWR